MTIVKKYEAELQRLEDLATMAANAMRVAMQKATIEDYKKFLDVMYHYTKHSENNLLNASRTSHTQELKEFFEHMAKEERGHYLLAQKDLEAFNTTLSLNEPVNVTRINTLWNQLKDTNHGNGYLGIVYVFENIAKYAGKDIKALLKRLQVNKKQSRWLSVHAEADLEHGADAADMVTKYLPDNPKLLIETAQKACELWIALNVDAFHASAKIGKVA